MPAEHGRLAFVEVVEPARAVADTALQLTSARAARALVTSAIQRRRCTPAALEHELCTGPRNHSAGFRLGVADALVNAKSVAEAEAVDWLTRARVPAFERNVPILDATGTVVAEADVLWRELRAVLEIDARDYHLSEDDWQRSLQRNARLVRHAISLQQVSPRQIRQGRQAWADGIADWLRHRARELGRPYRPGGGALVVAPDEPAAYLLHRGC